jgi:hypothetical protein
MIAVSSMTAACANPPRWLGGEEEEPAVIAPGEPEFDPQMVDRLIPGLTPMDQVRGWFGEPDVRNHRRDGTSEWVYNKARLREEDPAREAMRRRARERVRAREARELKEETADLFEWGRRSLHRMGDWFDRTFFYPPSPMRRRDMQRRENAWAAADQRRESERPELTDQDHADIALLADDSKPVSHYDLAIDFSRDGVVDTFRYQRNAGRDYLP